MKLHPQHDITFPYFDKDKLIASNGTSEYERARTETTYERRVLRGFISHRQHLAFRARFRKAFRGIPTLDIDNVKPFMQ